MARQIGRAHKDDVLAAIDAGTNAVRLELARVLPDGNLETLHTERDPVRPGEGLFRSGTINREVADRLVATMRRYSSLCRRYGARVRAVATSALRDAKNREDIVRRVRREAGINLEVVSGREEARLICLGVLHGKPQNQRSLCIDIGGGSTEIIFAQGETPKELFSVDLGAVRLTELFEVRGRVSRKQRTLLRTYAREMIEEVVGGRSTGVPPTAIGSSGTIGAVVGYARSEGVGHATAMEVSRCVEELADMDADKRSRCFDPKRAETVVAGAVILEAVLKHLKTKSVTAVDRGLREGVLVDLLRRRKVDRNDHSLTDGAIALGRRFGFSEPHGRQVARLAMALFDGLLKVHGLPAAARSHLEVASLLHDIGHAVNHQRHHKHSHYLIQNSDIAGLAERERSLVAAVARFHRRSKPEVSHEVMQPFSPSEVSVIRRCATLLRVADALDRSHRQPVSRLVTAVRGSGVTVKVRCRHSIDLELWDVAHEFDLFREVFDKTLTVVST